MRDGMSYLLSALLAALLSGLLLALFSVLLSVFLSEHFLSEHFLSGHFLYLFKESKTHIRIWPIESCNQEILVFDQYNKKNQ